MLWALMDKVDRTQEQTGKRKQRMEILGKNQKEMPETKRAVAEMKAASDGPPSGLDAAEKSTSELEAVATSGTEKETCGTERQSEQRQNPEENTQGLGDNQEGVTSMRWECRRRERQRQKQA